MAGSSLLHSMIADGKKLFLKNFNQGNPINFSRSIRRCKKESIFESFLAVESLFLSNYCSEWRLYTKMTPSEMISWKFSAWTVQKQPSTANHFRRFLQKIPVVESFFWSNYRLAIESSDYLLKRLHQECFLGNPPKDFRESKYHRS